MKRVKGTEAPLLDNDKKFLEIYLSNGKVGWRAYKESHSHLKRNDRSWHRETCKYMAKPKIANELAKIEKQAMVKVEKAVSKYGITRERIAEELARIAFTNATDVTTFGPHGVVIKNSSELSPEALSSISEIKESRNKETGTIVSVKHYDKLTALTALGKSMGMFVEQVEHKHQHVQFTIVKD